MNRNWKQMTASLLVLVSLAGQSAQAAGNKGFQGGQQQGHAQNQGAGKSAQVARPSFSVQPKVVSGNGGGSFKSLPGKVTVQQGTFNPTSPFKSPTKVLPVGGFPVKPPTMKPPTVNPFPPLGPIGPIKPPTVNPFPPLGPIGPVKPPIVNPLPPFGPIGPIGPVKPPIVNPFPPIGPIGPIGPIKPPVGPFPPIGPINPLPPIGPLPPYKRDIGMVFQNYALFPHMTIARNIAFPLEMRYMARAEIDQRVEAVLKLIDLPGYGARLPSQLSGGIAFWAHVAGFVCGLALVIPMRRRERMAVDWWDTRTS